MFRVQCGVERRDVGEVLDVGRWWGDIVCRWKEPGLGDGLAGRGGQRRHARVEVDVKLVVERLGRFAPLKEDAV